MYIIYFEYLYAYFNQGLHAPGNLTGVISVFFLFCRKGNLGLTRGVSLYLDTKFPQVNIGAKEFHDSQWRTLINA